MYVHTDEPYLYYQYNNKHYRVPTYGKILKIIDFGRAIYKFKDKIHCSDCFDSDGNAYSQYNCNPYIDESKPIIRPNPSFDLCRLACSMYSFLMDNSPKNHDICEILNKWIRDDKNKNILYKKNGDERYPDFKLYKIIVRIVNKHTPQEQLNDPYFSQFETQFETTPELIMNIDEYPAYNQTNEY